MTTRRRVSWLMAAFITPAMANEADEIRAQIEALRAEQKEVHQRQERIDAALSALEARLGAQPAAAPALGSAATATAPRTPAVALAAHSRLATTGDFRLRSQGDYADSSKDRNSGQIRARLGATFAVNERVTLGARLVTGDADDPNSTDVQLSNFDDDLQVSLDLAYVQLNFEELKLYGGKLPQPFTRTDLVWDGDVNPQGVSGVYKHALANGGAFRASSLFFLIDEQAAGPESTMFGSQIGYDSPTLGRWRFDVSAAYYDYRLGSIAGGDSGDFRTNLRNPDGTYASDFNLGDLIVGATWNGLGERWPVRFVGDYVKNVGAINDADTGYGFDISLGRASQPGDWRVTYGHAFAETDSVFTAFSHDNLSIASNYRLNSLTFDYVPLPKTMLSAIWYRYKPLDGVDTLDRVRLFFLVNL